ncbi:cam kinase incomplete catalytic triad [Cystoisospora suis]|uniref:Cam kinase incomplete catalytic triad n=1 Tax=Cystoisospora suis TaxID=483139 RepID=A0A2C6L0J5_9APIC|nr:cam kinase incomplete catalytic triad [Cystoisospora suis]
MIADGILGGEPKTPTTRTLEWLSSSHQEIDPPQNTSVMTEEGEGGEERERRRHRRERRAPQRYWYRGGWQRKPRRPPEFSRQDQRLSTTPSTLQPRQRAELAELIREVSLALANGRSSSLGPSSIDIQDPVTSLDTDRLSESGGETSLMRQSQECVAHRRSSSTSFDREKEGGVHTDAFHNYEDSEYTSPIVGDERTSPPTAPRVVLLHRRSHRRPRKEFRPSPRIPENTQLRISSPDERKTS